MSDIAQKLICLSLNNKWEPIGYKTVKMTIQKMFRDSPSAWVGLDIDYEINQDGSVNFDSPTQIVPVKWDEWIKLPVRSWDLSIKSTHMEIRVPTVVVAINFNKMPIRIFKGKPSKDALWRRDNGICQYTGKLVDKKNANIDHIIPKSRGGKDNWTNLVVCTKEINNKKGNKFNSEIGLNLIKNPTSPTPIRICELITEAKHFDWKHFLTKN